MAEDDHDDWVAWRKYVFESIKDIKDEQKWFRRTLFVMGAGIIGQLVFVILKFNH